MHKLVHRQRDRVIPPSTTSVSLIALTPASGNVRFFIFTRIRVSNAHTLITFPPRLLVYGARTLSRQGPSVEGALGEGENGERGEESGQEAKKKEETRHCRRMADLTRSHGRLSISCPLFRFLFLFRALACEYATSPPRNYGRLQVFFN